jgi:hypothetical protein
VHCSEFHQWLIHFNNNSFHYRCTDLSVFVPERSLAGTNPLFQLWTCWYKNRTRLTISLSPGHDLHLLHLVWERIPSPLTMGLCLFIISNADTFCLPSPLTLASSVIINTRYLFDSGSLIGLGALWCIQFVGRLPWLALYVTLSWLRSSSGH